MIIQLKPETDDELQELGAMSTVEIKIRFGTIVQQIS
jgi:hypothetical protein